METAVPNNQMAVISVVAGAIAWLVGGVAGCALFFIFPPAALCTGGIFLIASIVAVVTGHMGRRQIKDKGEGGDGMALTGSVLAGWVWPPTSP